MSNALGISPVQLGRWPLYSILVQFPVACFVLVLMTDLAYLRSELYLWQTFSVWLLAAGCVFAGLAGIVGLIIFLRERRVRAAPLAWPYAVTCLVAVLVSIINTFVHSRDGYTAVVPTGLALSFLVVVLMLIATAMGWASFHRSTLIGEAK